MQLELHEGSGVYLDSQTSQTLLELLYRVRARDMISHLHVMEAGGRSLKIPSVVASHFALKLTPLEALFEPPQLQKGN